jgi:hypothetical protein
MPRPPENVEGLSLRLHLTLLILLSPQNDTAGRRQVNFFGAIGQPTAQAGPPVRGVHRAFHFWIQSAMRYS